MEKDIIAIVPQAPAGFEPSGDMLKDIFNLQDALNARVSVSQEVARTLPGPELADWLVKLKNAGDVEFKEVLDHVEWKWWKRGQKPQNLTEAQKEWIDRFHFVLSEGLLLGITPDILYSQYMEKNRINHERQDTGY